MQYRWIVPILAGLSLATSPMAQAAAPRKPATKGKTAAKPQPKTAAPKTAAPKPVVVEPPRPGGFMTPKEVVLRTTTPAEAQANATWSIRAGLNVAALQCQFSGFLHTVDIYNAFLRNHGDELTQAQATMVGHFKRYDGARGANSFDQYNTKMYNSYSTLDAQYQFCDAAGLVGRRVLALPRGGLGPAALQLYPQMRAALSRLPLSPALGNTSIEPLVVPPIQVPAE